MPPRQSPTVRRRRLGALLRQLRIDRGGTIEETAGVLGWNATTLLRIEKGVGKLPQLKNSEALLDVYEVTDLELRETVLDLTRQARQLGWWHSHSSALQDGYLTYVGLEAEATVIRNFELVVIPGLFQTRAYAQALITGRSPHKSREEIADLVEVRAKRQQLLHGPTPVHVRAIIGEGALQWMVGGPQVMVEQLEHLTKLAQMENIHLQILPFTAGAHQGRGPFVILTFPEPLDPEVVYVETLAGDVWIEERNRVAGFGSAFERLLSGTMSESATLAHIGTILERLSS